MILLGARFRRGDIENMMLKSRYAVFVAMLAFVLSCSSDPEGPVTEKFIDDGTYGITGGDIHRVLIPTTGVTVSVPEGVGTDPLLILGRVRGIEYRAVLLKFDFTVADDDTGKTISSARLHLSMQVASPSDFEIPVTIHELGSTFSDTSSIVAIPPYDPTPIPDSLGGTVDTLRIERTEYDIDTTYVNGWISGRREHNGIALLWAATPDTATSLEMKAREYGSDPAAVRVTFTDGTSAAYPASADYTVAVFNEPGLNCVGGLARRIAFTYDPAGIPDRAMVNAAFLVLKVRGDQGFGGTTGEQLVIGYTALFYYYLYAPNSADTLSSDFRKGTGVDENSFDPTISTTIRMPLRGYMADVLRNARVNTGLVLQSNYESLRIQRACFVSSGDDAPYIELFYSLPADFGGAR
jgi:hypothetical protein